MSPSSIPSRPSRDHLHAKLKVILKLCEAEREQGDEVLKDIVEIWEDVGIQNKITTAMADRADDLVGRSGDTDQEGLDGFIEELRFLQGQTSDLHRWAINGVDMALRFHDGYARRSSPWQRAFSDVSKHVGEFDAPLLALFTLIQHEQSVHKRLELDMAKQILLLSFRAQAVEDDNAKVKTALRRLVADRQTRYGTPQPSEES